MLDQLEQKQPENRDVFLISRVTNLITKSKRFEIGRVKNLKQSETIFIGFGRTQIGGNGSRRTEAQN